MQIATVAALGFAAVNAELKPGSCPVHAQNKSEEIWDGMSMAGLWFEYVWEPSYQMGIEYQCSTWIILNNEEDGGPGRYIVYNNML